MKNQEIELDFAVMLYAGVMYTGLVISGWLLMRLTIACFKLPAILQQKIAEIPQTDEVLAAETAEVSEGNEDSNSAVQYCNTQDLEQDIYDTTMPFHPPESETRNRKKPSGKRSNAINMMSAEAELITKGLNSSEDVDGKRTTRSSTRVSTVASKLKNEPPAKKEKKTPSAKGGKRGRRAKAAKDEDDEVVSAEENGFSENNVDSKADKGGSSTEEEVDSKTEEKLENGTSSAEDEKSLEGDNKSVDEPEKTDKAENP